MIGTSSSQKGAFSLRRVAHGLQAAALLALVAVPACRAESAATAPVQDAAAAQSSVQGGAVTQVQVVFSGGHETDPRDRGRPVVLVAAALGVPAQVFRDAFSHVRPAPAGSAPDPEQVRRNKAALLSALGKYGVTNDRLDQVSNYYRYVRSRGELWRTRPAAAYALVKDGMVTGFVITDGGSGYSSPPTVAVPGYLNCAAQAQLTFTRSFDTNGSVSSITLAPPAQQ